MFMTLFAKTQKYKSRQTVIEEVSDHEEDADDSDDESKRQDRKRERMEKFNVKIDQALSNNQKYAE